MLNASTRSPGLSVLVSDASHAAVPEPGYMTISAACVPNTPRRRDTISPVTAGISGPR